MRCRPERPRSGGCPETRPAWRPRGSTARRHRRHRTRAHAVTPEEDRVLDVTRVNVSQAGQGRLLVNGRSTRRNCPCRFLRMRQLLTFVGKAEVGPLRKLLCIPYYSLTASLKKLFHVMLGFLHSPRSSPGSARDEILPFGVSVSIAGQMSRYPMASSHDSSASGYHNPL